MPLSHPPYQPQPYQADIRVSNGFHFVSSHPQLLGHFIPITIADLLEKVYKNNRSTQEILSNGNYNIKEVLSENDAKLSDLEEKTRKLPNSKEFLYEAINIAVLKERNFWFYLHQIAEIRKLFRNKTRDQKEEDRLNHLLDIVLSSLGSLYKILKSSEK